MINPRITAVWSTTKLIAVFSCTPCVQEVHTKAEVVQPASDYLIDVISENGVTDQFDESALCRVMITNTTGDSRE